MFTREELLIGKENLDKLRNSKVAIVGLGGVGGYVAEILVRAGIGNFILLDGDTVDKTNLNRQIISTQNNIGNMKTKEWALRFKLINKDVNVKTIDAFYTTEDRSLFEEENIDYIVDAIDDVPNKVDLIITAKEKNIPIVSAMGAGNRIDACDFQIIDIYKTQYDGLAKKMRHELKKRNVKKLDVCVSNTMPKKIDGNIGSISYNPALCGIKLGAYVINKLLNIK